MKRVIKHYTVFVRSDDFMKDQYVYGDFFDNKSMKKYLKDNFPGFHIVWVRID